MTTSRLSQSRWQSLDTLFSRRSARHIARPRLAQVLPQRRRGTRPGGLPYPGRAPRPDGALALPQLDSRFTRSRRRIPGHLSGARAARDTRSGCAIRSAPGFMGSPRRLRGGRGGDRSRGNSSSRDRRRRRRFEDERAHPRRRYARDARAVHEEVARLPASLREAIVLCTFEGLTYHAAARQLGVPEPTLRGRLRRARQRLEFRLRDRGIAALMPAAPLAAPSPALVRSTVQHAAWWTSMTGLIGGSPGIPASIAVLARSVLRSMLLGACKVPAVVALLAGGILAAAVWAQPGEPQRSVRRRPVPRRSQSDRTAPPLKPPAARTQPQPNPLAPVPASSQAASRIQPAGPSAARS